MSAILPLNRLGPEKPKIRFVQNGCGLQGMLAVLAAHLTCRNPVQIAVDQFHELVHGFHVAEPPSVEKARDIVCSAIFLHNYSSQL